MQAIVGECLRQDVRACQDRGERKQVFIGLNLYFRWNRPNPAQQISADSHAAGAQKSATSPQESCTADGVGLEAKSVAQSLNLFASVPVNTNNSMPHNS